MRGERELIAALREEMAALRKEVVQLRSRVTVLETENAELRHLLEDERRKGKRQAVPFSKGNPKDNPNKPGRKGGSEYGTQSRRPIPKQIDRTVTVQCPLQCPYCGGQVQLKDKATQYQTDIPAATVYLIERGRGYAEAAKILGEAFAGVIGSDGWAPYRRFTKAQRQTCLTHLLRRCAELLEVPPTEDCAAYFTQIKLALQDALALRDRRDDHSISQHGLRVSKGRIEARIDRLLDDPDLHDESLRFAAHLARNRDALFLFLDRADVEATNHLAEQAIRPAVINRKTSAGNRTSNGARAQGVLMSVLRTCKLRCISAMDVFRQMLCDPVPTIHLAR